MDNKINGDNLKRFGNDFQTKCISSLLVDKAFLERILDILDVTYFETDANRWIVEQIIQYFLQYKASPTLTVFKISVDAIQSELLKRSVIDQLRVVYQKMSDTDITYVKETFLEFCKNQKLKNAIRASVDFLKDGEYDSIKKIVDEALKAGMERNMGTDFLNDAEFWLSDNARTCMKTGWKLVDGILDGGLGNGELGIIMAPAGIGKCVGPNTEIEIQYEEIGIPIVSDITKEEYVLWISPFEKFDFGNKIMIGWEIHNILQKIHDIKLLLPGLENIHKK